MGTLGQAQSQPNVAQLMLTHWKYPIKNSNCAHANTCDSDKLREQHLQLVPFYYVSGDNGASVR